MTYEYSINGERVPSYNFSIIILDKKQDKKIFEKSYTDVKIRSGPDTGLIEILKIKTPEIKFQATFLIIDGTDYTYHNKPLTLFIESDENKGPIAINFSNKIKLENFFNRTAIYDIHDFNGAKIYIKNRL